MYVGGVLRALCCVLIWCGIVGEVWALGGVTLSQESFEVQEKATFSWTYEVGPQGLAQGDVLRVHDPVFHGMRWSKWGGLSPWWEQCTGQKDSQEASIGLVSAHIRRDDARIEDVQISLSRTNCDENERVCDINLHESASTEIEVISGDLLPGDEVVLGMGDKAACLTSCEEGTSCGVCSDCGFEMPDRAFPVIQWPAELCRQADDCTELYVEPIEIRSLSTVDTTVATVPSQAMAGEPFRLKVALLDRYGNAVLGVDHAVTVHAPDGPLRYTFVEDDEGWRDFSVTIDTPGVHRLTVDAGAMRVQTNPIVITADAPERLILWGDIHVHHGHTYWDEGRLRDANHDYGRDVVGLDVVSESQKALGVELGGEGLWDELRNSCSAYTEEGQYIVLLGFEWMGEFAAAETGGTSVGHHNVYYDGCDAPIGTHDVSVINALSGPDGLWAWLDTVKAQTGANAITVPHAMRWTLYDYRREKPGIQTLAEVYSEWGDNTEWAPGQTDEDEPGTTQDMLNSGLRLGWIGGSDNHDGWMGNPYSTKNVESGLGAFVVDAHTRAGVFESMQTRRTFATTGHRPILRLTVEDEGSQWPQGTELLAVQPTLKWSYAGTGNVEEVRLWQIEIVEDATQVLVERITEGGLDLAGQHVVDWDGDVSVAYWLEVRQWDGEKAWSSPIWLTSDCGRVDKGAVDPHQLCLSTDVPQDTASGSLSATSEIPKTRCSCAAENRLPQWWWAVGLLLMSFSRRTEPCRPRATRR